MAFAVRSGQIVEMCMFVAGAVQRCIISAYADGAAALKSLSNVRVPTTACAGLTAQILLAHLSNVVTMIKHGSIKLYMHRSYGYEVFLFLGTQVEVMNRKSIF
jgi:hypothetical protein